MFSARLRRESSMSAARRDAAAASASCLRSNRISREVTSLPGAAKAANAPLEARCLCHVQPGKATGTEQSEQVVERKKKGRKEGRKGSSFKVSVLQAHKQWGRNEKTGKIIGMDFDHSILRSVVSACILLFLLDRPTPPPHHVHDGCSPNNCKDPTPLVLRSQVREK